jgi:hypothetical protein
MEKNKIYNDLKILYDTPKLLFTQVLSTEALKYFSPVFGIKHYLTDCFVIYDKVNKYSFLIKKREDSFADIINQDDEYSDFNTIINLYPELKKFFVEIFNEQNLYSTLKMVESGYETDENTLEHFDSNISSFKFNKKNPGKSLIVLNFNFEEFFKLFDLDTYDINFCTDVFDNSYGYNDAFINYDTVYEDFRDGYFHGNFNDKNYESLVEIIKIIYPNAINDKNEILESDKKVYDLLLDSFDREISDIIDYYQNLVDEDTRENFKQSVTHELKDKPEEYNIITSIPLHEYLSTVKNLTSLYERFGNKNYEMNIHELLKVVFENFNVGPFEEYRYEYQTLSNENNLKFQNFVSQKLDDIKESIYDSNRFINVNEYKKLLKQVEKFGFRKYQKLPKDNERSFAVLGVDPSVNKIIVHGNFSSYGYLETKKMSLEEFNLFLYHPEFKF